jgi:adenosylhomocysteine nucleosidase
VTVIAVCGLKREAGIIGKRALAFYAGGDPDTLRLHLGYGLRDGGHEGIISIGIAGALSPDLKAGDVVIAERVVTAERAFETDAKWTARLVAKLPAARLGAVLGRSTIADTADVKAALHTATGADAVDMESHIAASVSVSGLPFAALRVISDAADRDLPPAALVAMKPDGTVALGRVLGSIWKDPSQLGALIRTGRESEKAFATLLGCVETLGPGLGCPYLR